MTEPREARLTDVLLHFDGTVLELTINNPDKTYRVYGYSAEQQPALEALVTAAVTARGAGAA